MTKYGRKIRKRKIPKEVPFDVNGNMLRSKGPKLAGGAQVHELKTGNRSFLAALTLHEKNKYGNSYKLVMMDTFTGKKYPIFISDFLKMIQNVTMEAGEIYGEWGFCQKSCYYGVYLISEIKEAEVLEDFLDETEGEQSAPKDKRIVDTAERDSDYWVTRIPVSVLETIS